MIRQEDKEIVENIKNFIKKNFNDGITVDYQKYEWLDTLDRIISNLEKASLSYKYADPKTNFWTADCPKCNWWGPSSLLLGGGQIADTGDYDDCYCPVCGNSDLDEKEMPDPLLLNKILYKSNLDHCQSADDMQNSLETIHDLIEENYPLLKETDE